MPRPSTTNPVQKICRILRVLSAPQPMRLVDVCAVTGLNKATALRLLDALEAEGFVQRDARTKRFALGEEALVLGIAMQSRDHVSKWARPWLVKLAGLSGDTIVLSTRHGIESVCVDREFGAYPIRANYLDIGSRRPLGVGAGSMALLAWLPGDEANAVLDQIEPIVSARYPRIGRRLLEAEIVEAQGRGYSMLLDVVVERMGGIGVPVFGSEGKPVAAISLAALNDRITTRLPLLVPALKEAAASLTAQYSQDNR
ncbi:MAG: IclR family transcriptional regulator [Gammaproteobacteria bacterium]